MEKFFGRMNCGIEYLQCRIQGVVQPQEADDEILSDAAPSKSVCSFKIIALQKCQTVGSLLTL